MPLDNNIGSAGKAASIIKSSKRASSRLTSLAESDQIPDDAPFRARLHVLFSQIEREFEHLYIENLNRKIFLKFLVYIFLKTKNSSRKTRRSWWWNS